MPANCNGWREETVKDIIYEFETLLFNHGIKINNDNPKENNFENENSYINIKEKEELKKSIIKQLLQYEDYIEYRLMEVA